MALALTTACVGPAADTRPPGEPTPQASAAPKAPAAAKPPIPAPQAARHAPAPPPPPPMPPEKLIGLGDRAVTDLLGRPAFRRADAPAELWRYRAGNCILDLFLYPPRGVPDGPRTVTHVEARQRNGSPTPALTCLDAVRKARPGAGAT